MHGYQYPQNLTQQLHKSPKMRDGYKKGANPSVITVMRKLRMTNFARQSAGAGDFWGRVMNMDDLISRQAAIDALDALHYNDREDWCFVLDTIEFLPYAQPEPKRGKWLPDNNNYIYEQYVCSECKNSFNVDTCMGKPMWNFCPNCGAKMEVTE